MMVQKDLGFLLLRLFVGIRLIYGVIDNVFDWQRMMEFSKFLEQFHFPLPLVSAVVSVYAQLIAGLMILIGWKIRWAAALMVINFLVALIMVHSNQSFEEMTAPMAILSCCLFFLLSGAGNYSLSKSSA